ncbi:hypothetical protein PGT21_008939 [Puccinia graminis f. sp. tritici]|uniref:Uncharacterized protein n=1 Tax=Puccinia graminis f. sp. tritici TaxID=56615 RepID=A0A5B0LK16_PUCGR|nr:hypothetical protein PGT21_008939 [Puccinia graminis f. sp. tritici]KAA1068063.1 hypothetical protein PGTUg99_007768 [Puccinia graminis f. sp. tritici]
MNSAERIPAAIKGSGTFRRRNHHRAITPSIDLRNRSEAALIKVVVKFISHAYGVEEQEGHQAV